MLPFHSPLTVGFVLLASALVQAHDMEAGALAPDTATHSERSLAGLVAQALENNRSLKAAEFKIKSLHSAPGHTWYLEPPQVGVEFYQAPLKSFPDPLREQAEIDYSIQQAFPFPGKNSSRIDAEHKHAEMSEAELAALRRKVIREIKTGYYDLYLDDQRLEINRQNLALMNRLIEIARRQYEVGLGRQADILRAQIEATSLKSDSISLRQSRQAMQGMLNAFLGRNTGQPIATADSLVPAVADWTAAQIESLLESNHPDLKGMQAAVRMREAEKSVAKKGYWPDFMVGGSYKDMLRMPSGSHGGELQDYWSVMVSMNLPIAFWSLPKYKAGVVQSDANLGQAREEYAEMRNLVSARAQAALLKVQSGKELLRISRSVLLPQSKQALESALAAYQGGKSDFLALLDAFRVNLMAKENSEMALIRLLSSQAELEEAVGLDWEEIERQTAAGALP
ncbi:MAG: TolC family protein [Fibrobacteria bacterium]